MRIEETGFRCGFGLFLNLPSSVLSPLPSDLPHTPSLLSGRSSVFSPHSSILFSDYCRMALRRLDAESGPLFAQASIEYRTASDFLAPSNITAVADARPTGLRRRSRAGRALNEHKTKQSTL
jgi:hypothetical protein